MIVCFFLGFHHHALFLRNSLHYTAIVTLTEWLGEDTVQRYPTTCNFLSLTPAVPPSPPALSS